MSPLIFILLFFVATPLIELYFLIEVGSQIGAIATIALTVFTAVLGGMLVRLQGISVLMRVRDATARGEVPALEMLEGVLLLLAGLALLLPGFITDAVGFLLLITPVRRALILSWLKRRGVLRPGQPPPQPDAPDQPRIIDGEFRRDDD